MCMIWVDMNTIVWYNIMYKSKYSFGGVGGVGSKLFNNKEKS